MVKMKNKDNRINRTNGNAGFTLVELVVVLVILVILVGIAIFGGLAWQDWTKFKHEEAVAEDIFFAAQNQLAELDNGGALERKISVLLDGDDYNSRFVLAKKRGSVTDYTTLEGIKYEKDKYYSWEEIWKDAAVSGTDVMNANREDKTILSLKAEKGDYDTYLAVRAGSQTEPASFEGTMLLFDLVSHYISDTSVLNGAILLEFSPESGQVFSVCFSDKAEKLTYNDTPVSTLDRTDSYRRKNMYGYYSVKNLAEKIRGRSSDQSPLVFTISNGKFLSFNISEDEETYLQNNDSLEFTVYDGSRSEMIMKFSLPYVTSGSGAMPTSLSAAVANPMQVNVTFTDDAAYENKIRYFGQSDVSFSIPVWKEESGGKVQIHMIMDAADPQAATTLYQAGFDTNNIDKDQDAQSYRNTFSFSRFGLEEAVSYVYGSVNVVRSSQKVTDEMYSFAGTEFGAELNAGNAENIGKNHKDYETIAGVKGECVLYASVEAGSEETIRIRNARHFYNMRYTTEYKASDAPKHIYLLERDIDWNSFTNVADGDGMNYFLNSYSASQTRVAGIDNGNYGMITREDGISVYPFPGFRCLGVGDSFTQETGLDDANHKFISNLTITFDTNVFCGIYDDVANDSGKLMKDIRKGNASYADILGITGNETLAGADSSISRLVRGGALPLGLFSENLGEISKITLNKHVVKGIEESKAVGTTLDGVVCTSMVGGFVGNNIGTVSDLTLMDHVDNQIVADIAGITHISGRTDVGGIIGRQSFVLKTVTDKDVVLDNLKNYGTITGLEYVGGIVGRIYTHYLGNPELNGANAQTLADNHANMTLAQEKANNRYSYFHDGYFITDNSLSMTGTEVARANKITLRNSLNRGEILGDSVFTALNARCAFIGGIAGASIDGAMVDGGSNDNNTLFKKYYTWGYFSGQFSYVVIENCNSYVSYETIEEMESAYLEHENNYAVGGISGYARLTTFSDCNADPAEFDDEDKADLFYQDGAVKDAVSCYVLGTRYVGGIAGCSDLNYFHSSDPDKEGVINYNNVIGRLYVGGIAGAFGIGAGSQQRLSFRSPSSNEFERCSQYKAAGNQNDEKSYVTGNNMKNTGVVLGRKTNGNYLYKVDPTNSTTYAIPQDVVAFIGGIGGAARTTIGNCSNIQSEVTKKLAMRLIAGDATNLYTADIDTVISRVENSKYGGNDVGGIVGHAYSRGFINPTNGISSYVDAIVFGEDVVGGVIGGTESGDGSWKEFRNLYLSKEGNSTGTLVLGLYSVGGMFGRIRTAKLIQAEDMKCAYTVRGKYGVGGIVGDRVDGNTVTLEGKQIGPDSGAKIKVDGIAYVGGAVGISNYAQNSTLTAVIKNMDVTAKYFAGGIYGALNYAPAGNINEVTSGKLKMDGYTVNVEATQAFAGGIAGLYAPTSNKNSFQNVMTNVPIYNLAVAFASQPYTQGYASFLYDNRWKNSGTVDSLNFTNTTMAKNNTVQVTVTAQVHAGGLFGFTPEGAKSEITGYSNVNRVITKGLVNNVAEFPVQGTNFSFLGGVIGRVPAGMTLTQCQNQMTWISNSNQYYSSPAAVAFIGGLTEINAGVIRNSSVANIMYYGGHSNTTVAPIAGVNGTIKVGNRAGTDGTNTGLIENCSNGSAQVGSDGSAAGIVGALCGGSTVRDCVVDEKMTIIAGNGKNAGGIAANAYGATGTVQKIERCVFYGIINQNNPANVAGILAKAEGGTAVEIRYCRNYGSLAGGSATYGITCTQPTVMYGNLVASGYTVTGTLVSNIFCPGETANTFARNFYIYGTYDGEVATAEGSSREATDAEKTFDRIDFDASVPGLDSITADVTALYNATVSSKVTEALADTESPYYSALNAIQTAGVGQDSYLISVLKIFANNNYYANDGVDKTVYATLSDYWEAEPALTDNYLGYVNSVVTGNSIPELGAGTVYQTITVTDNSTWPVHLFAKDTTGAGNKFQLVYKRWESYYDAHLGNDYGRNPEVILTRATNWKELATKLDTAFMSMVADTASYPDYDNGTTLGFVKTP